MRWHLFLQNTEQLDEKYGDKVGKTIRSNAETWIYLQSDSPATQKEISDRLGSYTIKSPSLSSSSGGQSSASYNLTGRPLMRPEEIHQYIHRPYQLVMMDSRQKRTVLISIFTVCLALLFLSLSLLPILTCQ